MATDDPILGNWHMEWREISNPYSDFNQTKLYELLIDIFSQLGHTHEKSDITDFTHTHSSTEITGLDTWSIVQEHDSTDKQIWVYANETLRLCELHWSMSISGATVNNNIAVSITGWLSSDYRPLHTAVVGGANYNGSTIVNTAGQIIYRPAVNLNSTTVRGNVMWHY